MKRDRDEPLIDVFDDILAGSIDPDLDGNERDEILNALAHAARVQIAAESSDVNHKGGTS